MDRSGRSSVARSGGAARSDRSDPCPPPPGGGSRKNILPFGNSRLLFVSLSRLPVRAPTCYLPKKRIGFFLASGNWTLSRIARNRSWCSRCFTAWAFSESCYQGRPIPHLRIGKLSTFFVALPYSVVWTAVSARLRSASGTVRRTQGRAETIRPRWQCPGSRAGAMRGGAMQCGRRFACAGFRRFRCATRRNRAALREKAEAAEAVLPRMTAAAPNPEPGCGYVKIRNCAFSNYDRTKRYPKSTVESLRSALVSL